jgi:hypothetical protein
MIFRSSSSATGSRWLRELSAVRALDTAARCRLARRSVRHRRGGQLAMSMAAGSPPARRTVGDQGRRLERDRPEHRELRAMTQTKPLML